MTKTIIYLDQSYISNLSRARLGPEAFPDTPPYYSKLLEAMLRAVHGGMVVCPASPSHFTESELAPHLEQGIYDTLEELWCGVSYLPMTDVIEVQVGLALSQFLDHPRSPETWSMAFDRDPHASCDEHAKIERSRGVFASWTRQAREFHEKVGILPGTNTYENTRLIEAFQVVNTLFIQPVMRLYSGAVDIFSATGVGFMAQLLKDFEDIAGRPPADADMILLLSQFLPSLATSPIPYIDVYSNIIAFIVTNHSDRHVQGSDLQDVSAASLALPFCDIYTTDAFMKHVISSAGLHSRYGCSLYSARAADVQALTDAVEKMLTT